jgi:DNA repair protein RecO (recombination protein O)
LQRHALEPAYVLHGRPFRDSSLIVEIFSREHGRQGIVARGARGAKSKWRNILQPFRPLLLSWNQRSDLGTLTGADQVASPPPLIGESLLCGLYINELLMRLLHRSDPHPNLFEAYQLMLTALSKDASIQKELRLFEGKLLHSLGFGLQLEFEADSGDPIEKNALYIYRPESGAERQKHAVSDDDRPTALVSGEALLALGAGQIQDDHLYELKMMMRGLIRYYLGDKPLASHSLFRK